MYTIPNSTGLVPKPHDPRTFNHEQAFGGGADVLALLPKGGLGRVPISLENQQATNFCTAYCTSTAAEYIEKMDMSPEFTAAKISEYVGYPILSGAPATDAMKAMCLFGALPKKDAPVSLWLGNASADEIADPTMWDVKLNDIAAAHKMGSFFDILRGSLDYFDNIRVALYQAQQAGEERVGMAFTQFWNVGIGQGKEVIRRGSNGYSWHAHLFIDWIEYNGETVLVEQNSFGPGWGIAYGGFEGGFSLWSREAVNQLAEDNRNECFMFRDADAKDIKDQQWTIGVIIYDLLMKISPKKAQEWLTTFVNVFMNPTPAPAPTPSPSPLPAPTPTPLPPEASITRREKILVEAQHWIGKDASPRDMVPDEVACVESVANIVRQVMPMPDVFSTIELKGFLSQSKDWKQTTEPKPGNIIVSVTGTGNGTLDHGHCGIFASTNEIMSNNSATGLWQKNYTVASWVAYFRQKGGMRVFYFEAL